VFNKITQGLIVGLAVWTLQRTFAISTELAAYHQKLDDEILARQEDHDAIVKLQERRPPPYRDQAPSKVFGE